MTEISYCCDYCDFSFSSTNVDDFRRKIASHFRNRHHNLLIPNGTICAPCFCHDQMKVANLKMNAIGVILKFETYDDVLIMLRHVADHIDAHY